VGKWGAGESYLLPLVAATSVLAGAYIARILAENPAGHPSSQTPVPEGERTNHTRKLQRARLVLSVALPLQMLGFTHGPISDIHPFFMDIGRQAAFLGHVPSATDRANTEMIVEILRRSDGPVLSEAPSFAIAAGKPVVANATHLRNLYEAGLWSPDALVADVRAHRFGVIVLNAQLYPAPVLAAIGRSYYLAEEFPVGPSKYQVFLPGDE
jgi:hypothetical protein